MVLPQEAPSVPEGAPTLGAPLPFRSFDPVRFGGSSRPTFKCLRQPTPLSMRGAARGLSGYLKRLGARFGWR